MKAAIIGMGPMGRRHVAALQRVTGVELTAVCDARPQALESDDLGPAVARFANATEMLQESRPDLVIVATNAPSHHDLVLDALAAGVRRILCEKPFAVSLRQARAMIDASRSVGAALAVNHCRRHEKAYRWLAERLASGDWGRVRGTRIACPGIGLGCLATHFVDLMMFVSGDELATVSGWIDPEVGTNPRGAQFHDPGGMVVATGRRTGAYFVHQQIEDGAGPASISIDLTQARVVVEESERRIEVIWRDPAVIPGPGRPPRFEKLAVPEESKLVLDIIGMTAGVLDELVVGGPLTCDAENGYRSLEAVVAAHRSHAAGHAPIALPISDAATLAMELPIT